jgi:hypothetical protein
MNYYIDCEFDGHNGPLLSIAVVREDGASVYFIVRAGAFDPWVLANVVPVLLEYDVRRAVAVYVKPNEVGEFLRHFIVDRTPTIIADSPVDIARFCTAISTELDGSYLSNDYPLMFFKVVDVPAYPTTLPGAVQHNAWWDAMALRHKLMGE